jgi:hypothetical protein
MNQHKVDHPSTKCYGHGRPRSVPTVKRLLLFLLAPATLAAGVQLGHQLRVDGLEALRPAPIVTQAAADVHAALCR